ncbi:MAG: HAD family hydrolase [Phycisphaerales bacterium]|nr:HAD family hydrolase [Phycisphaerales bacterium]
MRLIIEMDGPIIDPATRHWAAYHQAAGELQLPRLDQAEFWRRVRAGDPTGRWLPGAAAGKIAAFKSRFDELLEGTDLIAAQEPQEGIKQVLERLKRHGDLALVSLGPNKAARQALLDRFDISVFFTRMTGLSGDHGGRAKQVKELIEVQGRTIVAAASVAVIQAAFAAQLPVVGVAGGALVSKRLVQAGATVSFLNLDALAEEVETGGTRLVAAGLMPTAFPTVTNPFAGSKPLPRRTF